MSTDTILILNGPNLNLLGTREVRIYGNRTLKEIESMCHKRAQKLGLATRFEQSNDEGSLIDLMQEEADNVSGIILNAAAYTHTSLAMADTVSAIGLPVIEIHLSNVYARESYRHYSYLAPVSAGVICGFGAMSYLLALDAMKDLLEGEGKSCDLPLSI